jgi:DNA-directed RNA polymerase subunit RPC12/RpoP
VSDFEPTTDLPDRIDPDDRPVESSARARDATIQHRRKRLIRLVALAALAVLWLTGVPPTRAAIGVALAYVILMTGIAVLGAFARPVPEPPPPGELRRVKLAYRCTTCGTELRMTLADDRIPQAPRHCADEMELMTSAEDL